MPIRRCLLPLLASLGLLLPLGQAVVLPKVAAAAATAALPGTTVVPGDLSTAVTWTPEGSPHVLDGRLRIVAGGSLTILPGTIVKLMPTAGSAYDFSQLLVYGGVLKAQGTESNPIIITSGRDDSVGGDTNGDGAATSPARGDWYDISFSAPSEAAAAAAETSVLSFVSVRYGGEASGQACQAYGAVRVSRLGKLRVSRSEFLESLSAGFRTEPLSAVGSALVENSRFADSGCGMHLQGGTARDNVLESSIGTDAVWMLQPRGVTFSGNWMFKPGYWYDAVDRTQADVHDNALLAGVTDMPNNQEIQHLEQNWWGRPLGPASGCFDFKGTYIPAVSYTFVSGSACYAKSQGDITGYFTNVLPALDAPPPWPVAGITPAVRPASTLPPPAPWFGQAALEGAGGGNPDQNNSACYCAHPVSTATGELFDTVTDLALPGRAPVSGSRSYSSLRTGDSGLFGPGWTSPWDMLVTVAGTTATLDHENGSQTAFAVAADGSISAPPDVFSRLSRDPTSGGFTYVRRGADRYTFDATGRLVSKTDRNGERVELTWSAGSLVVRTPDGRTLTLSRDASGRVVRLTGPGAVPRVVTYGYDPQGRLVSVTDSRGKTWTYAYDAAGRMTSDTNPLGEATVNTFDAAGRIATQTNPRGGVWRFGYSVAGDATTTRVEDPTGVVTSYAYDRGLLQTKTVDPDGTPSVWRTTYDAAGNPTRTQDAWGVSTAASYDARGNAVTRSDGAGNLTRYTYDSFDQPLTVTDAEQHTTTYGYDDRGNLLSVGVPRSTTVTAVTSYERDPVHPDDVLSVTDPDGRVTRMTWSAAGLLASREIGGGRTTWTTDDYGSVLEVTAPRGNQPGADAPRYRTSFDYDGGGLLLTHRSAQGTSLSTYDDAGRLLTITDETQRTTSSAWWPDGSLRSTTGPDRRTTSFAFDLTGRPTATTGPDGATTTSTYDSHGRLATETRPSGNVTTATAAERAARTVTYSYDDASRTRRVSSPNPAAVGSTVVVTTQSDTAGRPWKVTDPEGGTNTTTYDALNRVSQVVDAAGKATTFRYDWAGATTGVTDPLLNSSTTAYSPGGLPTSVSDQEQHTTAFTYNAAGRLEQTIEPQGTCAGCSAADYTTRYGYDADGNRTSVRDALGRTTSAAYDQLGRVEQQTDAKGGVIAYTHDAAGRLLTVQAPDTGTLGYTYAADGTLAGRRSPRGALTSYAYDTAGRLASETDGLGRKRALTWTVDGQIATQTAARGVTTTYAYDALGRLVRRSYSEGTPAVTFAYDRASRRAAMTDAAGRQDYGYDALGRVTSISRAGTGTWRYGYDDAGNLSTRTRPDGSLESWSFDRAGLPTQVSTPAGTSSFTFDPAGHLLASRQPNGTTETQSWDRVGQLASVTTSRGTTSLVSQMITRDAVDNPTQVAVRRGTSAETRSYLYDSAQRLAGVCYVPLASCTGPSAATQSWTYDVDGNRATEKNGTGAGTTTTYAYDATDRLTSRKTGNKTVSLTYDADGNVLNDGTTSYSYDAENRTASTRTGTGTATAVQRDGDGNLLKQTTGTAATSYTWDLAGSVPHLATTTGTAATSYRYDPLGRLSTLSSGTVHQTVGHDAIGTVTDLLSSAGAVVRAQDFTPFGSVRTAVGAPKASGLSSRVGYAGLLTGANGTWAARDRDVNPVTGRWTGIDPVVPDPGRVFDSPYTYAANAPATFTDPTGEFPTLITGAIGAGFGAMIGGGLYALQHQDDFDAAEFWKQTGKGAVTGGVAGLTGGAAGGLATGALARFGVSEGVAAVAGGVTAGAVEGATGELLYAGLDPCADLTGSGLLTSAGIGSLTGGIGGRFARPVSGRAPAAAAAEAGPSLRSLAGEVREAGLHPAARNNRTVAVGADEQGNLFAGSSNGFDRGQREALDRLGITRVPGSASLHAEEELLRGVSGLQRVGTSVRTPCGPSEHNCALQLLQRGVAVEP